MTFSDVGIGQGFRHPNERSPRLKNTGHTCLVWGGTAMAEIGYPPDYEVEPCDDLPAPLVEVRRRLLDRPGSKLVRDRVPDIIRAEGRRPYVTVDRGPAPLLAKMCEEVAELEAAAGTPGVLGEAADVWEVFAALVDRLGLHMVDVHAAALAKRRERGGFDEGFILH